MFLVFSVQWAKTRDIEMPAAVLLGNDLWQQGRGSDRGLCPLPAARSAPLSQHGNTFTCFILSTFVAPGNVGQGGDAV